MVTSGTECLLDHWFSSCGVRTTAGMCALFCGMQRNLLKIIMKSLFFLKHDIIKILKQINIP